MIKINLEQKMFNIRGKPVLNLELDDKGKPIIKKGEAVMKNATLRDYLLTILGTRFPLIDKKEPFWTTELGILFSDGKKKEVEISDDKAKFLKRIIENNKVMVSKRTPMGIEEVEKELFFPFELGQLLKLFEGLKE